MDEKHCAALAKVDYGNFTLSLLLLFGVLISYLPQHIRIISRRSSYGLSPYFVLLGTTSSTHFLANILVVPTSQSDIACCHAISGFACFAGLLGIAQIGVQWCCFATILLLYLIFFPRATPSTTHPDKDPGPTYRTALTVALVFVVHGIITIIMSLYFIFSMPEHLQAWADFQGLLAAILSSIQYFPQIFTTYKLKRVGSLSIPMMCIQTPGSFVWAFSLAARLGVRAWSTYGILLVTGCLQGTLLVMGSYYEIMHRKKEKEDIQSRMTDGSGSQAISEETPLLRSAD